MQSLLLIDDGILFQATWQGVQYQKYRWPNEVYDHGIHKDGHMLKQCTNTCS